MQPLPSGSQIWALPFLQRIVEDFPDQILYSRDLRMLEVRPTDEVMELSNISEWFPRLEIFCHDENIAWNKKHGPPLTLHTFRLHFSERYNQHSSFMRTLISWLPDKLRCFNGTMFDVAQDMDSKDFRALLGTFVHKFKDLEELKLSLPVVHGVLSGGFRQVRCRCCSVFVLQLSTVPIRRVRSRATHLCVSHFERNRICGNIKISSHHKQKRGGGNYEEHHTTNLAFSKI